MKTLVVLLLSFVYLCHFETAGEDDVVGEMPLEYFRTSGLEAAMANETVFAEKFIDEYKYVGTDVKIPIQAGDESIMTVVGSTPIEEIERSELAATLNHAGCALYDQVVTIPNNQPNVLLYPSCVQLKRCGGCCGHTSLACKPTTTIPKTVQVLKYIYDGKSARPVEEVDYIQMDEHTGCECQCKLTAADCTPGLHYFDDWDCKCACERPRENCASTKRWDENLCGCRCASIQNCGTGFTFNMDSCVCEEESERAVVVIPGEVATTTPAAAQVDPCATLSCPRRYKGVLSVNGMCLCEFIRR